MTPCVPHDADHCPTCGMRLVRSALAAAPKPATTQHDDDPHAAARTRARTERAERKETPK